MKKSLAVFIVLIIAVSCTKRIPDHQNRYTNLTGQYLGQTVPDTTVKLFAPGIVSTGLNERDACFSPNGNEFFFSIWQSGRGTIVVMKKDGEYWLAPQVASFSGVYNDIEPFITSDGNKLFFVSNRPVNGTNAKDYDIWYVEKIGDEWGKPKNLGAPVNSPNFNEFYPTLTTNGDIYFTSNSDKAIGSEDIFVCKYKDGKYSEPINLGDSVNTAGDEFNSFIAPDGSYLLYTTAGVHKGLGGGDLWVTFKKDDQTWTTPKNLGASINSNKLDYCPSLTPDGKYLFFTSNRVQERKYNKRITYDEIIKEYNNPYNGAGDIYWVSSKVIKRLK